MEIDKYSDPGNQENLQNKLSKSAYRVLGICDSGLNEVLAVNERICETFVPDNLTKHMLRRLIFLTTYRRGFFSFPSIGFIRGKTFTEVNNFINFSIKDELIRQEVPQEDMHEKKNTANSKAHAFLRRYKCVINPTTRDSFEE